MRRGAVPSSCATHPEAPEPVGTFDLEPGADGKVEALRRPRRDQHSARTDDAAEVTDERSRRTEAAQDYGVESSGELVAGVLEPPVDHAAVSQLQLPDSCREKRAALLTRLDQRHRSLRQDDSQRYPGDTRAGADIRKLGGLDGKREFKEQAVDNDVVHDPSRLVRAYQPLAFLPFSQ